MSKWILVMLVVLASATAVAQPSFFEVQKSYPKVARAVQSKQDTLRKQLTKAGFNWPPEEMYIRSFKYDSQMEVWIRGKGAEEFKLFKTYKVCAMAGTLGPKRMEGDYQVPEGFYYISEFNPRSSFHLSLKLNYPNQSDKILSDSIRPGGGIYIHGSCITVGCIPITDEQIEELYVLAAAVKNSGQDFIPVHIFPIRYNKEQSVEYLARIAKENPAVQHFAEKLKQAFDYFDKQKQLPVIAINKKGEYLIM